MAGTEANDYVVRAPPDETALLARAEAWPGDIKVKDRVVHLWSSYMSDAERGALVAAAESSPGVQRVETPLSDNLKIHLSGAEAR
jgi:hypothetical protein